MKFTVVATSIISCWIYQSTAIRVPAAEKHPSPAVVSFPFQRHHLRRSGGALSSRVISQRPAPFGQVITNRVTFYSIDLFIGKPNPQKITLLLDTGSSDAWVTSPSTDYCQTSKSICDGYGIFDPRMSQTFRAGRSGALNVVYSDHTFARGDYGTDTITIADKALTGFQFGIATTTNIGHGTLGLGSIRKEAEVILKTGHGYPNFPQALVDQKFIKSKTYSLWFNDLHADTGSIVFGGVDTAKFFGKLVTFSSRRRSSSALNLEHVSLGDIRSSSFDVAVDSGSQNTMLPPDFARDVWNAVHVVQGQSGDPFVDCSLAASPTGVDFNFGSTTIHVPMSQLVYKSPDGKWPDSPDPNVSYCSFGIIPVPTGVPMPVLGDTFLRSAYVVFDLNKQEISIAPTKFTSESAIVELDESGVGKLYDPRFSNNQRPISPYNEEIPSPPPDGTPIPAPPTGEAQAPDDRPPDPNSRPDNEDDGSNVDAPRPPYDPFIRTNGFNSDNNGDDDDYDDEDPFHPSDRRLRSAFRSSGRRGQENEWSVFLARLADKFPFLKGLFN